MICKVFSSFNQFLASMSSKRKENIIIPKIFAALNLQLK
eukprot:UN18100